MNGKADRKNSKASGGRLVEARLPQSAAEGLEFPLRINRFLALCGIATRREADRLVEQGAVRINGETAELGKYVREGDRVEIEQGLLPKESAAVFLAFSKPAGISADDALRSVRFKPQVFAAGRLPKDDEGLMILTSSKRAADILQNPASKITCEYVIRTQETINQGLLERFKKEAEERSSVKAEATLLGEKSFRARFAGSRQDLGKICESMRRTVISVRRVKIGPISLRNLIPGAWKKLEGDDLERMRKIAGA